MNKKLPAICTSNCPVLRKRSRSAASPCMWGEHPQHSPWKTAAFWMTRNFSSMLADCSSCSMCRRAAAWYFSSIFLEQHVEPFGIQTCRSVPAEAQEEQKIHIRRWNRWECGENQLQVSVWQQLLFGQTDDISGICPEQAAWPEERIEKAEPRLLSSGPQSCACLPAQCLLLLPHTRSTAILSLALLPPVCPQHSSEEPLGRKDGLRGGKQRQDLRLWFYSEQSNVCSTSRRICL